MVTPTNDPNARIVYKPVARKSKKGVKGSALDAPKAKNPYIRAANEDDDGYDPYSDRREEPPLFEPNPWD